MKLTIDEKKLTKALALWGKLTKEEQARQIRFSGRALAVRLTNATQPFGMDADTRKKGENAVLKDIVRITKPLTQKYYDEAKRMSQYGPEEFAKRFTTKGNYNYLKKNAVALTPSTIKEFHQKARSRSTGRTIADNQGYYLSGNKVAEKYIKQTQKKVGIAKAGWAECAAQLGGFERVTGVGKIQKWVFNLINKYGRGSVKITDSYVELKNSVPWIGRALSRSNLQQTLDIQRNTLAKSVIKIVKDKSKAAGFA
jgi:hypothetical protein